MEPPLGGPPLATVGELDFNDQIFRLSQDNRDLKDYAERITKELRRYQAARPTPPPARPEDDLPLPPWATNMQMMSPLLFAYEERIAELETVVERSVNLAEQSQALTRENDQLRAELQERTEQLRTSQLMAPLAVDSREPGAASQQLEELQELYRLSVEQNEALAQQNQLLKVQLERMQQTLVAGQQQAREAQARVVDGARVISAEQERAESLARQRAAAEQRLDEVTGELVEEVRLREELQIKVDGLQHDLSMERQSLDNCKKSFNERCLLAQDEEERLKTDLSRSSQTDKEQRQRIIALERDLAQTSEQLFLARSEADAAKQEAEQMIKLMESMEKRLQHISDRNAHDTLKLTEHENQVAELLLEKDRWLSSDEAAKKHADRIQRRLEDDIERLRLDRDRDTENMQSSHRRAVSELEEQLRKSEQASTEFQSKLELTAKQRTWEANALDRQTSVHSAEKSRLQGDLDEAHQARLKLDRQIDESQHEIDRLRADLDASAAKAREQAGKAGTELAASRSRCQDVERQLAQTREDIQTLEARLAGNTVDCTRLQSEISEVRSSSTEVVEAERRRAQLERQRLERQIQNITLRAHQDEQKAVELMRAQEANRQRWQAELGMEKDALESQIERLMAENRQLREKGRRAIRTLAAQRLVGARAAAEGDERFLSGGGSPLDPRG